MLPFDSNYKSLVRTIASQFHIFAFRGDPRIDKRQCHLLEYGQDTHEMGLSHFSPVHYKGSNTANPLCRKTQLPTQ